MEGGPTRCSWMYNKRVGLASAERFDLIFVFLRKDGLGKLLTYVSTSENMDGT